MQFNSCLFVSIRGLKLFLKLSLSAACPSTPAPIAAAPSAPSAKVLILHASELRGDQRPKARSGKCRECHRFPAPARTPAATPLYSKAQHESHLEPQYPQPNPPP